MSTNIAMYAFQRCGQFLSYGHPSGPNQAVQTSEVQLDDPTVHLMILLYTWWSYCTLH